MMQTDFILDVDRNSGVCANAKGQSILIEARRQGKIINRRDHGRFASMRAWQSRCTSLDTIVPIYERFEYRVRSMQRYSSIGENIESIIDPKRCPIRRTGLQVNGIVTLLGACAYLKMSTTPLIGAVPKYELDKVRCKPRKPERTWHNNIKTI